MIKQFQIDPVNKINWYVWLTTKLNLIQIYKKLYWKNGWNISNFHLTALANILIKHFN